MMAFEKTRSFFTLLNPWRGRTMKVYRPRGGLKSRCFLGSCLGRCSPWKVSWLPKMGEILFFLLFVLVVFFWMFWQELGLQRIWTFFLVINFRWSGKGFASSPTESGSRTGCHFKHTSERSVGDVGNYNPWSFLQNDMVDLGANTV